MNEVYVIAKIAANGGMKFEVVAIDTVPKVAEPTYADRCR